MEAAGNEISVASEEEIELAEKEYNSNLNEEENGVVIEAPEDVQLAGEEVVSAPVTNFSNLLSKEVVNDEDDSESTTTSKKGEDGKKGGWLSEYGVEGVGFIVVIVSFELFMLFFGFFLLKNGNDKWIDDNPEEIVNGTVVKHVDETVRQFYGVFIDVAVMIFIGFGLLMAFLRKGGYLAMGMGFLLACIASHWALFVVGYSEVLVELINKHDDVYEFVVINIPLMIKSLFASGAILISMGVVIGKFSPLQMVIFVILEVPIYALNVSIVEGILHVSDVGGSMLVHTFGAYFGIAMSWVATPFALHRESVYTDKQTSIRTTNVFSMLGTVVLWVYWPSFCGALEETYQQRVIIHTYLALTSGCIIVFAISRLLRKKFGMPDLQNSTLAAGVAIGTCANMKMPPGAAIGIGLLAGTVSVFGYKVIQPLLEKIYLHDSCGVNNLHGLPGIIGGLAGVFASIGMKDELEHGKYQPLVQLAGLAITIGISAAGGALVGGLLRLLFILFPPKPRDYFEDDVYFKLSEEKEQEDYDFSVIKERLQEETEAEENAKDV